MPKNKKWWMRFELKSEIIFLNLWKHILCRTIELNLHNIAEFVVWSKRSIRPS
jgi:hypothetical protein